jgi:hypothetical protein
LLSKNFGIKVKKDILETTMQFIELFPAQTKLQVSPVFVVDNQAF